MSFWGVVWESFKKIQGIPGVLLGIVLAVVLWLLTPEAQVPFAYALPIALVLVLVIITFADAAYQSYRARKAVLPGVIDISQQPVGIRHVEALFLLQPSELFYYGMSVSFFLTKGHFEYLVGVGFVHHIQDDGRIQAALVHIVAGYEDEVRDLIHNPHTDRTLVQVKTNVPREYLGIIQQLDAPEAE